MPESLAWLDEAREAFSSRASETTRCSNEVSMLLKLSMRVLSLERREGGMGMGGSMRVKREVIGTRREEEGEPYIISGSYKDRLTQR